MIIKTITTRGQYEQLMRIRRSLNVNDDAPFTPEISDERIEDGYARRKSRGAGDAPPVNLCDTCAAIEVRDTKDVPFLKNAVRAFCGWPLVGRLERVHLDENGVELPWLKALRERLRTPETATAQTVLRTALAALPGDPWLEIKGTIGSTLHSVRLALEAGNLVQARAHVRECIERINLLEREGVPRVWPAVGAIETTKEKNPS